MKQIVPHTVIVTLRVTRRFEVDARTPEEAEAIVEGFTYDTSEALDELEEVEDMESFPTEDSNADNETN